MAASLIDWLRSHAAGRRGTSLALTVLAHVLLLLLLLQTTYLRRTPPPSGGELVAIDVAAPTPAAERAQPRQARRRAARGGAQAPQPTPPPPPVRPPEPVQPWTLNPELAGFDLRRLPSSRPAAAAPASAGAGTDAGDSDGADDGDESIGQAPGGGRLYEARWVREPTDAELSFYMPRGVTGYGDVACRTIARNKVEDCQVIGESPPGTGIARSVRDAAWQFLVWPPRLNGKLMVGSWVRIRITLTPRGSRAR